MTEQEFANFATQAFSHEPPKAASVPLFGVKHKHCVLDRSGVLLRIAGASFLLTAKHNLPEILDEGYLLAAPASSQGKKLISIACESAWFSTERENDYGLLALNGDTSTALEENGYRFLGIQDVEPLNHRRCENSFYLVKGFPHELNAQDKQGRTHVEIYNWITWQWDNSASNIPSEVLDAWDEESELLLAYPKDASHSHGDKRMPPRPNGMSGAGVWFARDFGSRLLWNPSQMRLVAIQVSWFPKSRCLRAISIDKALSMIWRHFPETRASLGLIDFFPE